MGKKRYPRTEAIMVMVRKAINTPHGTKDCLKHLEAAHDAVEKMEADLIAERLKRIPAMEWLQSIKNKGEP